MECFEMAIYSDIEADKSRCPRCANLLRGNIVEVSSRVTLQEHDDELYVVIVKDVTCGCGNINRIDYFGEPLSIWFEKSATWLATVPSLAGGESIA